MKYTIITPTWLSISVAIDYACTLWFAGNKEYLIENEHSMLLAHAVEHNILIPYLILIMAVYFICAYIALDALHNHRLFPVACTSIMLVAISHTFGGISWYIRNDLYSQTIITIPLIAFGLMVLCFMSLLVDRCKLPFKLHRIP
jgi:uncharacterized protein (DUF486 family)